MMVFSFVKKQTLRRGLDITVLDSTEQRYIERIPYTHQSRTRKLGYYGAM
jgi:hypothetical protein